MKYNLLLTFLVASLMAAAQDQIFKKDNTKVDAKILEISPTEIRYKLFTYQDGPLIIINKSEVAMVIYQNGTHEVFNTPASQPGLQYVPDYRDAERAERLQYNEARLKDRDERFAELTGTKQVVFFKFLEMLNGGLGVSYLREFGNNLFNVYVPVSVGLVEPGVSNSVILANEPNVQSFKYTRKVIDVGLGLNIQTSRRRPVTHFIGPLVGVSQFNGAYSIYQSNNYGSYYGGGQTVSHTFVANNYYFMVNNGFLFRITKDFNMMIYAAVGFQQRVYISGDPHQYNIQYNVNGNYSTQPVFPFNAVKFGFDFGYRF